MATAALPRQSASTRGAGTETSAAGKLCAATAPETARELPSSTVASGKPRLRSCTLSLVEHELQQWFSLREAIPQGLKPTLIFCCLRHG
jgi:hypothetical protein